MNIIEIIVIRNVVRMVVVGWVMYVHVCSFEATT